MPTVHIVRWCFLLYLLLAAGSNCFSQDDLCKLPMEGRGFAAPANASAYQVLDAIGEVVPFETRTIRLFPSSGALVKQRGGAAAQLCGHPTERWIFFDQVYIDSIKPKDGKNGFSRYFVLAHEAAHHINGDTLDGNRWTKDEELAADYSAAEWLTRLGVSRAELLRAFDDLGVSEKSVNGYPTREERRAKVIEGIDHESARGLVRTMETDLPVGGVYGPNPSDGYNKPYIVEYIEVGPTNQVVGQRTQIPSCDDQRDSRLAEEANTLSLTFGAGDHRELRPLAESGGLLTGEILSELQTSTNPTNSALSKVVNELSSPPFRSNCGTAVYVLPPNAHPVAFLLQAKEIDGNFKSCNPTNLTNFIECDIGMSGWMFNFGNPARIDLFKNWSSRNRIAKAIVWYDYDGH